MNDVLFFGSMSDRCWEKFHNLKYHFNKITDCKCESDDINYIYHNDPNVMIYVLPFEQGGTSKYKDNDNFYIKNIFGCQKLKERNEEKIRKKKFKNHDNFFKDDDIELDKIVEIYKTGKYKYYFVDDSEGKTGNYHIVAHGDEIVAGMCTEVGIYGDGDSGWEVSIYDNNTVVFEGQGDVDSIVVITIKN